MRREYEFYVYIVASRSRTLYIGVTNGLLKRVRQHREGVYDGFTKKYKISRLVYYERFGYIDNAIAREKELKGWLRARKIALISSMNPTWEDLYETSSVLPRAESRSFATLRMTISKTDASH